MVLGVWFDFGHMVWLWEYGFGRMVLGVWFWGDGFGCMALGEWFGFGRMVWLWAYGFGRIVWTYDLGAQPCKRGQAKLKSIYAY